MRTNQRFTVRKWLASIATCLLLCSSLWAQTEITGTVTNLAGEPLVGATIYALYGQRGTLTQEGGRFRLEISNAEDTLRITYLGYVDQRIPVSSQNGTTEIQVVLESDALFTEEVVVVGYGTQRKSDLTGAVSSVDEEELRRIPTASVAQALQGKAAGIQVTPSSGAPGAGAIIRVRGVGTLNDASPLFVVDDMWTDDISFLNLNDVKSIEVLKDASATAIYGARGANGVIIITTKQGNTGKTQYSFNAYYGSQALTQQIDLTNAQEYAILSNELAANDGRPPVFDDPMAFGAGTNWQDEVYQQAPMQNYYFSASGGGRKTQFNLSLDYFNQEGIIRGSEYQRYTFRINNRYNLAPYLRFGHNLAFLYETNEFAAGVVGNAYRADPTVPVLDSLGNFSNTSERASVANPAAQIFYNNNSNQVVKAFGNVYLEVDFLKDFTFRTSVGLDGSANQGINFVPVFFVSPIQQNDTNVVSLNAGYGGSYLWENTLNYQHQWGKHRFEGLAGITFQEFRNEFFGGSRRNVPEEDPNFFFLSAGQLNGQTNYHGANAVSRLSFLGRINYSYDGKYLLTANIRRDGSSFFGENNRFGTFPSISAGWNIAQENFMQSLDWVDRLKLRASYGQIGNDKLQRFGFYPSIPSVNRDLNTIFGTNEAVNIGALPIALANPDLRWETTTQADIGLEINLFNNRFSTEIDFYNKITTGILVPVPIPDYVGSRNFPVVNAAEVLNRGWDFNLSWRDNYGKFGYEISGVASTVYNEVLALGQGNEAIFGGGLGVGGILGTRTVVGSPIGAFYGYRVEGVFQSEDEIASSPNRGVEQPGDLRFADTDEDGVITAEDRTMIGTPIPDFVYGFSMNISYAGLMLSADFNGVSGNQIINSKRMARFGTPNFEQIFLERWTEEAGGNTEPRVTNGGHNYEASERFVQEGAFMRLRNLQLSYTLAPAVSQKFGVSKLRVYVSGTNLVTWTAYTGYTPEISSGNVTSVGIDSGQYPIAKTYTGGIELNF